MHTLPLPVISDPNDIRARQSLVDVLADGVPLRMLLDSGAARTAVPYRADATLVAADPPEHGPLIRLASLRWGSLAVSDLLVSMDPDGWPHPPLLGIDILAAHACHFRFSTGVLELDGPAPAGGLLPLSTPPGRIPMVPVEWGPVSTNAIWDTGAGITIVNRTFADAHPDIVTISDEHGHGTDAYGRTGRNPKGTLAPCTIGGVPFPAQPCGVARLDGPLRNLDLSLGLPIISHADWYLDFPQQRWNVHRHTSR